jgi:hypothetical protein
MDKSSGIMDQELRLYVYGHTEFRFRICGSWFAVYS